MKSIVVIGHFAWKSNEMIGAVVKARNILLALKDHVGKSCCVDNVDIYQWRQRKTVVILELINAFAFHKNIVLVISDTQKCLMRFFSVLQKFFHNNVLFCVVGAQIANTLSAQQDRLQQLHFVSKFLVETHDCAEILITLGLNNTEILRNFKDIRPLKQDEIVPYNDKIFRFCTFSRVTEMKGITDAINAINIVNEEAGEIICRLDVYGEIDETYNETFNSLINNSESCFYRGVVGSENSVQTLRDYFALIFPTKYQTEGIPGTIIDAFAAGIPIICSNWVRCKELVSDGENGIVYDFNNFDELVESIKKAIRNPSYVNNMKINCLRSYIPYTPSIAIRSLINSLQ